MISLLQLRYFCALARGQGLTRTAEQLYVSQSTLSAAISKLEKEVGVQLFDREKNRIFLNASGKEYLRHIETALEEIDLAKGSANQTYRQKEKRVALAASHSIIWQDMVQSFKKGHPDVYIQFKTENLETYQQRLLTGDLDFVITGMDDLISGDLDSLEIGSIPLCLCTAPGHPFAKRKSISLQEIGSEPYVDLAEGLSFRRFCDSVFQSANVKVNRVYECESEARPGLIWAGEGVAITPDHEMMRKPYEGLCFIPISDPGMWRRISLYWLQTRKFSPTMLELRDFIAHWL